MALFSKLKQVQELRKQAKDYKNTMGEEHITGSSGAVTVTIDGTQKVESVTLNRDEVRPENTEKLQENIKDAIADAQKQLQKVMLKKLQSGELKMPELGK